MHVPASTVFVIEYDFTIDFSVFNFGQRSVLGNDFVGALAFFILDYVQTVYRLDAIFNLIIQPLSNLFDRLLGNSRAETNQHFRFVRFILITFVPVFVDRFVPGP